jgi:predicted DNA-binding antitoxin AbrB/MazE fold protein
MTMTGVVVNGMIKPDQPLGLPDGEHVRIELVKATENEKETGAKRLLEIASTIKAQVKGPVRFTREELHERD